MRTGHEHSTDIWLVVPLAVPTVGNSREIMLRSLQALLLRKNLSESLEKNLSESRLLRVACFVSTRDA